MANYNGQLRTSEVFQTIFNMILKQEVFGDNFGKHQDLVDKARIDLGLAGDTALFYSCDCLRAYDWDGTATNVLEQFRPDDPKCQAISLTEFKQIPITIDFYLSRRAWSTESAFNEFTQIMLGMLSQTRKVIDGTTYNCYIGTTESNKGKQIQEIDISTARGSASSEMEANNLEALAIAQGIADLIIEMGDYSRDFNDYGFLRSYSSDDIKVIWNSFYNTKIRKTLTPALFHTDNLVDKLDEDVLPARYFGTVITSDNVSDYSASTPTAGKPIDSDDDTYVPGSNHANGCIRSLVEKHYKIGNTKIDIFPGTEIPAGSTIKEGGDYELGEVYIENANIICKIVTKFPVFASSFSTQTNFVNPRSLSENYYLTWGFNKLAYFENYPFITVKAK